MESIKKFQPCQYSHPKTHSHPAPLHLVVVVGPLTKWGIYFMQCKPTLVGGDGYIIVVVEYFTKWAEDMPTFIDDGKNISLFIFNHINTRFRFLQAITIDHSSHFRNHMMVELRENLGFHHENSSQ
jgi:hypothetical protein